MRDDDCRDTLEGWLHEWTRPGYQFTPLQIVAYAFAQQLVRKPLSEWGKDVRLERQDPNDPKSRVDSSPLTMSEAALFGSLAARDEASAARETMQDVQAKLWKFDLVMALRDPSWPTNLKQLHELASHLNTELPAGMALPAANGTGTDG